MGFSTRAVGDFVRQLAEHDKAASGSLVRALESINNEADLATALAAFTSVGEQFISSGLWDARTLVVRKSNFKTVAEVWLVSEGLRTELRARPAGLQRAYSLALQFRRTILDPTSLASDELEAFAKDIHRMSGGLHRLYKLAEQVAPEVAEKLAGALREVEELAATLPLPQKVKR